MHITYRVFYFDPFDIGSKTLCKTFSKMIDAVNFMKVQWSLGWKAVFDSQLA